jgi:hypothetical protein
VTLLIPNIIQNSSLKQRRLRLLLPLLPHLSSLRLLHRLFRISEFLHSLLSQQAVPSFVICVSEERELDDAGEGVEDFLDWDLVPFCYGGEGEELLTGFGDVDDTGRES